MTRVVHAPRASQVPSTPSAAASAGASAVASPTGTRRALAPPAVATTLVCAGCGTVVRPDAGFVPRCPERHDGDDVDHVLARRLDLARLPAPDDDDPNPFVRYRGCFHGYHVARASGRSDGWYVDHVRRLDDAVARVDGHGFRVTPFVRAPGLAEAAGLAPFGTVWAKDETGNVAGSHKARHLFGVLLELAVAEAVSGRPIEAPLAIASCGNAALAAAVVARAAGRDLRVFVPEAADPGVLDRLRTLCAEVVTCERRDGEAGDPAYLRLQESLAAGAVPFTCQGPENGLVIEGGATLGWEIADQLHEAGERLDRIVVQVGGGALASAVALAFEDATAVGCVHEPPILDTVQTGGGWPLARAWRRLLADLGLRRGVPLGPAVVDAAMHRAARARSRYMWPWETEPYSVARGILDDETYDWAAVVRAMLATGGRALVAGEELLLEANALARAATGIDADETGTAGVAGLLVLARDGVLDVGESVAVILSGVRRSPAPRVPTPVTPSHRSTQ